MPRPSASARSCEAVVFALAAWTVACNAVALLGGSFHLLLGVAAALAGLAVLARRLRRGRRAPATPRDAPASREPAPDPDPDLRPAAAAAAGVALAAGLWVTSDPTRRWAWAVAILAGGAALALARDGPSRTAPAGRARELALWATALLAGALPLLFQRPSIDDAFYLNVAVAALDRPELPLLRFDTLFGVPDLPLLLPVYRVSAFELLGSLIAWLLPITAIQACHQVLPALFGALVPLAHALLFRILAPHCWLAATLVSLLVLLCWGEPSRGYGNFGFVLLHQGKGVFVSVLAPLLIAYALELGRRPDPRRAVRLCAAQVAAVGMTSTAIWAAPTLSLLALASALPSSRRRGAALLGGLAASAYPLAAGLALRGSTAGALAPLTSGRPAPELLREAWELVLGSGPLAAAAPFAVVCTWALCREDSARRLAAVLPLGFLLLLFDPFLAAWTARNVTGEISFFRIFWVLPLPILFALLLVAPLGTAPEPGRARLAASALLTALFAVAAGGPTALGAANRVRLEPLGLKVPAEAYEAAAALAARAPAGSFVLAPEKVSHWIGTFHRHPFALVPRDVYLEIVRPRLEPGDYARRYKMARVVSRELQGPPYFEALARGLEHYRIAAVCVEPARPNVARIERILAPRYERAWRSAAYDVWVRRSTGGGAAD